MAHQSSASSGGPGTSQNEGMMKEAKDTAENVAHKAQEKAGEAKDKVEAKAREVAHEAEQKASEVGHMAGEAAKSQAKQKAETGKDRVAESVGAVGEALRLGAQQLQQRGNKNARYAEQLAGPIEQASQYLQRKQVDEMATEVEQFARRHTATFVGGAFALGMLGARFLKSSGEDARRQNLPAPMDERPQNYEMDARMDARPEDYGSAAPGGMYG